MIYFVDEDEIQLKPLLLELALRNYQTQQILNADEALKLLGGISDDDFLFIDVMLAANPDESKSAFTRDQTEDYKTTGLQLTERIIKERPNFPVKHIVLMSQAASRSMKGTINAFVKKHAVRYISKSAYDDPMTFGDEVEKIIKEAKV